MKRPESVNCKNCMFAQPIKNPNKDFQYSCHFNPPILDGNNESGWPIVHQNSWCGRYRSASNLDAVEWVTWVKGLDIDGQMQK